VQPLSKKSLRKARHDREMRRKKNRMTLVLCGVILATAIVFAFGALFYKGPQGRCVEIEVGAEGIEVCTRWEDRNGVHTRKVVGSHRL
jgi:hypothetical protein